MNFAKLKYLVGKNRDGNTVLQAPVVFPITPPNGPWSGSNSLGQVVDFAPNSNNTQTILRMDEWGPPEIWTLSLGLTYNGFPVAAGPPFNFIEIEANIDYGAGGTTQHIRCSWLNGTRISLPMNAVSVQARYGFDFKAYGAVTMQPPTGLRLSAILARGYMPSNAVLLTEFESIGPSNFSDPITIPPFTKTFEAVDINGSSGLFTVNNELRTYSADVNASINVRSIAAPSLNGKLIQLMPTERYLRFYDSAGVGTRGGFVFNIGT